MIDFIKKILKVKTFQNVAIYGSGQLITGLISFLLVPIYTHFIAPSENGVLSLIIMFITISYVIIDSGMTTAFSVRFYKVEEKERNNLIFNIFIYYLIFFAAIFCLFFFKRDLMSAILREEISFGIQMRAVVIIAIMVFVEFFINLLILIQKSKIYLVASVVRALILMGMNIVFLMVFRQNYDAYLNSWIISLAVVAIIATIYYLKKFDFKGVKFEKGVVQKLLKIGLPLIPHGLIMFVITSGDRYLLKLLGSSALVGLYTTGYRFGNLLDQFFTIPFGKAFSPILYKTYAKSPEAFKHKLADISFLYTAMAFVVLGGLLTFIDTFFTLFIDSDYWSSFVIIPIVALSLFLWGTGSIFSSIIVVKEKTHLTSIITGISAVLNVGLNFLLIPKYDILGAAIATLASYFIVFFIIYFVTRQLIPIKFNWKGFGVNLLLFGGFSALQIMLSNVGTINVPILIGRIAALGGFMVVMWIFNSKMLKQYVGDAGSL